MFHLYISLFFSTIVVIVVRSTVTSVLTTRCRCRRMPSLSECVIPAIPSSYKDTLLTNTLPLIILISLGKTLICCIYMYSSISLYFFFSRWKPTFWNIQFWKKNGKKKKQKRNCTATILHMSIYTMQSYAMHVLNVYLCKGLTCSYEYWFNL